MNIEKKKALKKWALELCVVCGMTMFLSRAVFMTINIPTASMVPTIPERSFSFGLRASYWFSDPKRGDVVVFKRDNTHYIKRVVGLPGDTVEIKSGVTYVNGEVYDESAWLQEEPEPLDFGPFVLEENQYFVMGDNRNNSLDCRYTEPYYITRDMIKAKYCCNLFQY